MPNANDRTDNSPPASELVTYRITHRRNPGTQETEWISQPESTRRITGNAALALKTAAPLHQQQTGLLVSLPQVELLSGRDKFANEIRMLQMSVCRVDMA
jgi:hypothetical protein